MPKESVFTVDEQNNLVLDKIILHCISKYVYRLTFHQEKWLSRIASTGN